MCGVVVASYPLLSQAPTPVEVELGCDNIASIIPYLFQGQTEKLEIEFKHFTEMVIRGGVVSKQFMHKVFVSLGGSVILVWNSPEKHAENML